MLKTFFCIFVATFMWQKAKHWLKINRSIGSALKWSSVEATLIDYQTVHQKGKLSRFQNSFSHYCFAKYHINQKIFGCHRISFHDIRNNINHDFINDLVSSEKKTVTVWYDPDKPGDNVFLNPTQHNRSILMIQFIFLMCIGSGMIAMAIIS